jgi:hypothetical protein
VDPLEAELLAHRVDLFAEDCHRPFDVLRPVRPTAADLVVEHDGPLRRKPFQRGEVMVRRARPTVQRQERRRSRAELACDSIPRAIAAKVDVTLGNSRAHAGLEYEVARPLSSGYFPARGILPSRGRCPEKGGL